MRIIRSIFRVIDTISDWTAMGTRWLCAALVLVFVFEVLMRYVFNAPTIWTYETVMMMGGTIIVLGWANVHRNNRHIRIDVFYSRFSPRKKAITDVICASVLFFPLMIVLIDASATLAWESYVTHEIWILGFWFPPTLPSRIIFLLGVCLFTLQGIAVYTRDWYFIIRRKPLD